MDNETNEIVVRGCEQALNSTVDYDVARLAVYGGAIGDALGAPYELTSWLRRGEYEARWTSATETGGGLIGDAPAGTWTDDTSMSLSAIESFHRLGEVNAVDLRSNWTKWLRDGEWTCDGKLEDAGMTVMRAVAAGHGLDGEWDQGNGSLMRAYPLALTDASDDDVMEYSAATHAHENYMLACVQWTWTLRGIIKGMSPREAVLFSMRYMRDAHGWASSPGAMQKLTASSPTDSKNTWVIDALETAGWLLCHYSTYRECLLAAASLGGDTDTICAIVGPAAALAWGLDDVEDWVDSVRRHDLLDEAAQRLSSLGSMSAVDDRLQPASKHGDERYDSLV